MTSNLLWMNDDEVVPFNYGFSRLGLQLVSSDFYNTRPFHLSIPSHLLFGIWGLIDFDFLLRNEAGFHPHSLGWHLLLL